MWRPETDSIDVPVLQAVGSKDDLFYCGLSACADTAQLHNSEAPYFSASPSYISYVLPGSGHDLNLAINHAQFFSVASQWMTAHVWAAENRAAHRRRRRLPQR